MGAYMARGRKRQPQGSRRCSCVKSFEVLAYCDSFSLEWVTTRRFASLGNWGLPNLMLLVEIAIATGCLRHSCWGDRSSSAEEKLRNIFCVGKKKANPRTSQPVNASARKVKAIIRHVSICAGSPSEACVSFRFFRLLQISVVFGWTSRSARRLHGEN